MRKYVAPLPLLLLLISFLAKSQPSVPPENYFDFWIGEWELTWQDPDGTMGTGKNTLSRILGDKVILETFEGLTGQNKGYLGKSWSVYNPQLQQWNQTWVDSQGSYLDFVGEFDGENRMFSRKTITASGQQVWQRMVFKDIAQDSFIWVWESSTDGGKTWQQNWKINYKRAKG